uniref:MYCBP associated protein n=1 Tax=Nannospalax galili TaxID=1026970 RepID=A0A8C6RXE8_NANGA
LSGSLGCHLVSPFPPQNKLTGQEAVTVAQSVLQELLRGISTPQRMPSPVDAYLTEEDLFCYRNPRLYYQYQVVQNLHQLWDQYIEAVPGQEDPLSARAQVGSISPVLESPQLQHEIEALRDPQDSFLSQKTGTGPKNSSGKSIMEEILVEENLDMDYNKSPWEQESSPLPRWNLCLEDFRKAVMTLPEEPQREEALIQLNKAAVELCQEQKPLQSNILHQMCLQLWRDVVDNLVSHSLWLKVLLELPEKETVYLDMLEEQDRKSLPVMEVKVASGKVGKEERKGAAQEKKQLGIRDKEDKKGAKAPGKEDRLNSKKQKTKDEKKIVKSTSRDRLSSDDPTPDSMVPSQEPIDPLVLEKYTQRLHAEVYGLLDTLVTEMMVLADELGPTKSAEDLCVFAA